MVDLVTIVAAVGPETFQRACQSARATAPLTGKGAAIIDSDDERLVHDVADTITPLIWHAPASDLDKVEVLLQVYDRMPCYTLLFDFKTFHYPCLSAAARAKFLQEVRVLLSSEDEVWAGPLTYSLWCDFLEDPATVEDVWTTLVHDPSDLLLERLLSASGPVPFPLKEELYASLVKNPEWHEAIYHSLLASTFEYFGNVNKEAALQWLQRLTVPPDSESMVALRRALASS